jgi:hypothetical protein
MVVPLVFKGGGWLSAPVKPQNLIAFRQNGAAMANLTSHQRIADRAKGISGEKQELAARRERRK